MNAFSAAIDATFLDANMAADAVFRASNSNALVPCRVILSMPDVVTDFGVAGIASDSMLLDVRVSEVPAPTENDRFTIDGEIYVIQGAPLRDKLRLTWRAEIVPENRTNV